jgi:hypothetical protein
MRRFFAMVVMLAPLTTICANGLTYADIENMPVSSLAERMLGAAGKVMIDVERPRALPGQLIFFSRAFAPGSQYGVCSSEWVTLHLEKNGEVQSILGQERYGHEGSIYTKPEEQSYRQFASMCKAAKNTRSYFPAPNAQAALTIIAYIDALAGRGPSGGKSYAFECSGSCTDRTHAYLKTISLDSIVETTAIDCDEVDPYHSCYKLRLEGSPPADYPRELRIYGQYKNPHVVEIQKVKLWVGTTLY